MNFMQGTLDVLILTALADGSLHGYDVVEWIRAATNGALEIDDGALYTSLHRMLPGDASRLVTGSPSPPGTTETSNDLDAGSRTSEAAGAT